nr:LOW QUALITY PROTEIN: uncharacterized protein LOC117982575 [Maniola hyperantus]
MVQGKIYKEKIKEKGAQSTSNFSLKKADDGSKVCDIAATINHVEKMHHSMPKKDLEQYVKSLSCHKYKNMPRLISIKYKTKKHTKYRRKCKPCKNDYKNLLKWDWIRDKRSLIVDDTRNELDDYEDNEKFNDTELHIMTAHDDWDNNAHINYITNSTKKSLNKYFYCKLQDEIFVTMWDSVSFICDQPHKKFNHSVSDYVWNTDRNEMLDHDNIVVEGSKIFIRDVAAKNFGTYVCSKGDAVVRSIKVTITSIPSFNIVFKPVYRTDSACTYKDLKEIQMLNSEISRECCGKYCSARIDEPICLKDRADGSSYVRPIVVISLNAIPNINCSCECKRNLQCSITRLLLSNMPPLAFVKVLISFDSMSMNKTLTPLLGSKRRSFVTHTLRRRDSNGHYEYHNIAAHMEPGNFDLVLLCSAGFYLLSEQKICVVCPSNTFSEEGDNTCRTCPQGTRAAPGSRSCRLAHQRLRRFVWNTNEWSITTFCVLALSAFAICYGAIRLLPRACRSQGNNTCNSRGNTRLGRRKPCQKSPSRRSVSPSHVILSRLLQGSITSSRATDSQENRFELWKEKNTLPPLPPIDFDL